MRRVWALLVIGALALGGCEGGTNGDASPSPPATSAEPPPDCPPAGADTYSGSTSEGLCVTIGRDAGGAINVFEIGVMATCTVGFGEGGVTLNSGSEVIVANEAASDAGTPFEATVSVTGPIVVGASGSFESGNLTGTIDDSDASGGYVLSFTATLVDEISCTGGPVTWEAARAA